jgi:hypothetical protein
LRSHASGGLWLWSDIDIVANPGFLRAIRAEYNLAPTAFMTSPYRITRTPSVWGVLDPLFVDAEFLPGVLLIGRKGSIRVAFGAGVLFAPQALNEDRWDRIGSSLADDNALARELGTGRLSAACVETEAHATSFKVALAHYWRWQKTIRWCNAAGYFGQIAILPLVGWFVLVAGAFSWASVGGADGCMDSGAFGWPVFASSRGIRMANPLLACVGDMAFLPTLLLALSLDPDACVMARKILVDAASQEAL